MDKKSQISFVIAIRSDVCDSGSLVKQFDNFSNILSQLCSKNNLNAELIVVEWNSPDNRSKLSEYSRWHTNGSLEIRIITVPLEVHDQFRNSDTMPFFEMIARNVGIRRAHAPFILATNINVIFSEGVIKFLARGGLSTKRIYTQFCHGVGPNIPDGSVEEQLKWCSDNAVPVCPEHIDSLNSPQVIQMQGQGELLKEWRSLHRRHFYPIKLAAKQQVKQQLNQPFSKPKRLIREGTCRNFVMMSKDAWEKTRGYIELPIYPIYLDELLIHTAISLGLRQSILASWARLYHVDRDIIALNLPLEKKVHSFPGMPWLDTGLWLRVKGHYVDGGEPIMLNDDSWGLAQHDCVEQTLM